MSLSSAARQLDAVIRKRGLTRAEAEKLLRVSSGAVTRWIGGDRSPTRELSLRIRDEFGIEPDLWDVPASAAQRKAAGA